MDPTRVMCPGAYPTVIDTESAIKLQQQLANQAQENQRLREQLAKYEVALEVSDERYNALKNQKTSVFPCVEQFVRHNETTARLKQLEDTVAALTRQITAHENTGARLKKENSHLREDIADLRDQIQFYQKRDHASAQEIWQLRNYIHESRTETAIAKADRESARETVKTTMGVISEEIFGLTPASSDWYSVGMSLAECNTPACSQTSNAIVWTIDAARFVATQQRDLSIFFSAAVAKRRLTPLRTLGLGLEAALKSDTTNPFELVKILHLLNALNKTLAVVQEVPASLLGNALQKLAHKGISRYGHGYGQHAMAMAIILALLQSMTILHGRFGIRGLESSESEIRDLLRRAWPSFQECIRLVQGVGHTEVQGFVSHYQQRYHGRVFGGEVILRDDEDTKYFVKVDCGAQTILVAPLESY